jgi:hypothetical protein
MENSWGVHGNLMRVGKHGIMKSMTVGKKYRGFAVVGGKTPDAGVRDGAPQVAPSRSPKKQRRKDVIDREYRIWREELL